MKNMNYKIGITAILLAMAVLGCSTSVEADISNNANTDTVLATETESYLNFEQMTEEETEIIIEQAISVPKNMTEEVLPKIPVLTEETKAAENTEKGAQRRKVPGKKDEARK